MGNDVHMAKLPEMYKCTALALFEPHYGEHSWKRRVSFSVTYLGRIQIPANIFPT